jgi:hypothetical protein
MDRFVLRPCKLRESRFVPLDGDPLVLNWKELCGKLAPSRAREAVLTLRALTIGAFVGLLRRSSGGPPSNFVLVNQDRSGNVAYVLHKDTSFEERLIEVYLVEEVEWSARTTEMGIGKRPQHV